MSALGYIVTSKMHQSLSQERALTGVQDSLKAVWYLNKLSDREIKTRRIEK